MSAEIPKLIIHGKGGDYVVINAITLPRLVEAVQGLMAEGYTPLGSLLWLDSEPDSEYAWWLQAMVKKS